MFVMLFVGKSTFSKLTSELLLLFPEVINLNMFDQKSEVGKSGSIDAVVASKTLHPNCYKNSFRNKE